MDGSAAVDVDATPKEGGKKADPSRLQVAVDPKLLVTSKSKGPPLRRKIDVNSRRRNSQSC